MANIIIDFIIRTGAQHAKIYDQVLQACSEGHLSFVSISSIHDGNQRVASHPHHGRQIHETQNQSQSETRPLKRWDDGGAAFPADASVRTNWAHHAGLVLLCFCCHPLLLCGNGTGFNLWQSSLGGRAPLTCLHSRWLFFYPGFGSWYTGLPQLWIPQQGNDRTGSPKNCIKVFA